MTYLLGAFHEVSRPPDSKLSEGAVVHGVVLMLVKRTRCRLEGGGGRIGVLKTITDLACKNAELT
jgi:hypothetical protein